MKFGLKSLFVATLLFSLLFGISVLPFWQNPEEEPIFRLPLLTAKNGDLVPCRESDANFKLVVAAFSDGERRIEKSDYFKLSIYGDSTILSSEFHNLEKFFRNDSECEETITVLQSLKSTEVSILIDWKYYGIGNYRASWQEEITCLTGGKGIIGDKDSSHLEWSFLAVGKTP